MLGRGVLPKGPQGSPSRLPSPRRWESELRLFSAESWSVLTKLCLQRDSPEPPGAGTALLSLPRLPCPPGVGQGALAGLCAHCEVTFCRVCCLSRSRCH